MAAVPLGILESEWSKKAGETADQWNVWLVICTRLSFTQNVGKDLVMKEVGMSASEEVLQSQWTRRCPG